MTIYRIETLQNWERIMYINGMSKITFHFYTFTSLVFADTVIFIQSLVFGCGKYSYDGYGYAVVGMIHNFNNIHRYGEDSNSIKSPPIENRPGINFMGCNEPYAWGWIAAIFFVFVTVLGGLLFPTLLVALITACTDEASRTVSRELKTVRAVRNEINTYPEFYSMIQMRRIKSCFGVGYL